MTEVRLLQTSVVAVLVGAVVLALALAADADETRHDAKKPQVGDRLAAAEIDRLVTANLVRKGLEPNTRASDEVFLRRSYLDVVGRIPDLAEARAFLESSKARKRADLLDQLFDAPGYASHQFNFWSDLLRVKTRLANRVSGEPYIDYLKTSISENKPYDVMVREMLTATGAAHERGNGATGYLLRDRGMPLDNMANSVRIFLGTRLECAQCHNHPTEKWTQRQFFEMAAFAGGVRYANDYLRTPEGRELVQAGRKLRSERRQRVYRYFRRQVLSAAQAGIGGSGTGFELLPQDYQYDDGEPNQPIVAKTLYGRTPSMDVKVPRITPVKQPKRLRRILMNRGRDVDSRAKFAAWVTAPKNPEFARVIANRMWKKIMGRGLIEPVDDMRPTRDSDRKRSRSKRVSVEVGVAAASNPELMSYLETLMRDVGYDLKRFQKILCSTRTYQRESSHAASDVAYHFPGPLFRRMTSEQAWDSLVTLVVPDVDANGATTSSRAEMVYANYDRVVSSSVDELLAEVDSYFAPGSAMEHPDDINRKRVRQRRNKVQPLVRKLVRATRRGNTDTAAEARRELEKLGIEPDRVLKERRYGRGNLRAADLTSPAPAGHLVRDFGQSDRGEIQGSHSDPSVPQALTLINGFVEKEIFKRRQGVLMSALQKTRRAGDKVRIAYVAILSRPPTDDEANEWRTIFADEGKNAYKDLVWTLVNSHEFRFVQ
ncbi:MAG: DUF1549 domain-containing protein [Planctomycetota bacterium]